MATLTSIPATWRRLLPQGLSGHHALFEPEMIRFTMRRDDAPTLDGEAVQRLMSLLDAVEDAEDTDEGRDWIAGAPLPVQETLVRAYFETLFAYLDEHSSPIN